MVVTGLSVKIVGGLDLLWHVRRKDPDVAVIVTSSYWDPDARSECYKRGC